MHKTLGIIAITVLMTGCGQLALAPTDGTAPSEGQTRPQARPGALDVSVRTPPTTARTVEEFDTTTAEERTVAASVDAVAERALGGTIVSLGDPTRPGFWIETPLATASGQGRVLYPGSGQSSQVTLIPIDGPATAGSRLSLAAMRLIGAPLTGLVKVQVFSGQ